MKKITNTIVLALLLIPGLFCQNTQKPLTVYTKLPSPTYENAAYGQHERNVLDFWKGQIDNAPLLIYIHGGGFVSGDKTAKRNDPVVLEAYNHGFALALINYRFVTTDPYPAPMQDGVRALQFLRSKSVEWNINPEITALAGGSAGANMSLWIAFRDDMKNIESSDPVERESTRVSCVLAYAGQTSNDLAFIKKYIYSGDSIHTTFFPFYDIKSADEIKSDRVKKLMYDASSINFLTKDDPPVFLLYDSALTVTPLPEGTSQGVYIHHPRFGELLAEQMNALGMEYHLYYKGKQPPPKAAINFLLKHCGLDTGDERIK